MQIILGSLLGGAAIEGGTGRRCFVVSGARDRADYVRWKYERLASLALAPPELRAERVGFRTIAHPLFDDLAWLTGLAPSAQARALRPLLGTLGLAVWMADLGRLELRADLFVPGRGALAA